MAELMSKARSFTSSQDASPKCLKSRDLDSLSRWSEYLTAEESSSSASTNWKHVSEATPSSGNYQKALHMEWVVLLSKVADGLLAKLYRLYHILDRPDVALHTFSDSFWKAGVVPNFPKLCILLSKKFPEHPNKLQLDRVRFLSSVHGIDLSFFSLTDVFFFAG